MISNNDKCNTKLTELIVFELDIVLGVPCRWYVGAGEELYKDPPEEELFDDIDAREGAVIEGIILEDLVETL